MIEAPEARDRTPLRYAQAVLAGNWEGVAAAAAKFAPRARVRAFGPGVQEAAAREMQSSVEAMRSLSDAVAGLEAPQIIACHAAPTRIWAMRLLEQANAHRLRVYALDGGDAVRPWSLRDVLRPETAAGVDAATARRFSGRRVLVTGAGGSIGQALVMQLARCQPEWIGLLDYSEFNLFTVDHALGSAHPEQARSAILCDVRDQAGVQRCFAQERPDIVFHAAALKHVPIVELHACQGVLTNVGGTRNVAEAVRACGAHMVFVSTDKAVNPANVMGATKRLGELLCQTLDRQGAERMIPVRLGNVLGSAGSVSPLFAAQIAMGGPLTVTHPGVTRYFITIQQAAEFLLRAAAQGLARPEQRGVAHVLDMGEPVKVMDLARVMAQLQGLQPEHDIPITVVGLRPGEKLTEQLIADEEQLLGADGDVRSVACAPRDLRVLEGDIEMLLGLARSGRDDLVAPALHRSVAPVKLQAMTG